MLSAQDLKLLYDMAQLAPMQRAGDSHAVSDLFKRVEAELQTLGEESVLALAGQVTDKRKADEEAKKPAAAPNEKIDGAVKTAVAEAQK